MTCFTATENSCRRFFLPFKAENVINCVHNETVLWNPSVNGSEEENELAWRGIADLFRFKTGNNTHRPSTLLHSDASLDLESILDCVSVSLARHHTQV